MTEVAPINTDTTTTIMPAPTPEPPKKRVKMVSMELKRHYRPMGEYEIVGHTRPAKEVKNAAGEKIEVHPAKFIEGEMFPSVYGGVGFENKIWAGTTIRVPEDEARTMRDKGIAERGFND